MARTIKVFARSGYTTPTLKLINNDSDSIAETITLTEGNNGLGIYRGSISTAGAGNYDAVLLDGAVVKGAYGYVRLSGTDPEQVEVGDSVGVPDGIKLDKQIQRTNQAGDTLTESVVET